MKTDSIEAYDLAERVQRYDADMDIMHPLRHKMIDIACEIAPFERDDPLRALDLGVGTGVFTQRLLEHYPNSSVVAVDGAAAMLELAKTRLGQLAGRVAWVEADFLALPSAILQPGTFDLVVSSYALHHLDAKQKLAMLQAVVPALKSGGWLLNADIFVAETTIVEQRVQDVRVAGIVSRAPAGDSRFSTASSTRALLDELEAAEHDQPQTLSSDLAVLREAGITDADVFWKEYREAVIGGPCL